MLLSLELLVHVVVTWRSPLYSACIVVLGRSTAVLEGGPGWFHLVGSSGLSGSPMVPLMFLRILHQLGSLCASSGFLWFCLGSLFSRFSWFWSACDWACSGFLCGSIVSGSPVFSRVLSVMF